jgi:hypothetical protein
MRKMPIVIYFYSSLFDRVFTLVLKVNLYSSHKFVIDKESVDGRLMWKEKQTEHFVEKA